MSPVKANKPSKEMFKLYDVTVVPDIMPFPELSHVATTKGQETAVPKLNEHQRSWIHDVALRGVDLPALQGKAATAFYDKVKIDAFTAKAFQHTAQVGDHAEEARLPTLITAWKRQNKEKMVSKNKSGGGATGEEAPTPEENEEKEDEGGRIGLLRGYSKAGGIQKVISNKRAALARESKHKPKQDDPTDTGDYTEARALAKLLGLVAYTGRDKFRDDCHNEIHEYSQGLPGNMNAGGRFRKAEAILWAEEDQVEWNAAAASNEDVDWQERQKLIASGFQHMVDVLNSSGKFRPFVSTMIMTWVDITYSRSRVEAVPKGVHVGRPFEKQYPKLAADTINAMYAWAEKPLQDHVAAHETSAQAAAPTFPLSVEALDDMSPKAVAQAVTHFLVTSYEAAFGAQEIPWATIATTPQEYYDSTKFELRFTSDGLGALRSTQWHPLAVSLASGAGDGSSGFFRKACAGAGAAEEDAGREREEAARVKQVEEDARREREAEDARVKQVEEDAHREREEEAARVKQVEEDMRREREEEEEAVRVKQVEEDARREREEEDVRREREEEEEAVRVKQVEEDARREREEEDARVKQVEEDARRMREAEEDAGCSGNGEQGKSGANTKKSRKRKAEVQLVPEEAGVERRATRKRQTPQEAELERQQKLTAAVTGKKVKPSFEYVARSPVKSKSTKGYDFNLSTIWDETEDIHRT
ncbi:hypothetical protein C8F04DRAFT_1261026 [Mycena alexandri]|uniref:Uncharacterized protein n=1 Tax=Mycena alexandri TaxID=1745969 RepID=A0AAD6SV34_9AGAR|nr:hypothetical protein C8F04DRAFT_1261026 [Mycena alexandri]